MKQKDKKKVTKYFNADTSELTEEEDACDEADPEIIGPELDECHANCQQQADRGTDIGNEGQKARHNANGDAKFQPREMQRESVENPKPKATQQLPAQPGR